MANRKRTTKVAGAARPNGTTTRHFHATLADGRGVQCFVNVQTGLLVVDVIDRDERGGIEVLRRAV